MKEVNSNYCASDIQEEEEETAPEVNSEKLDAFMDFVDTLDFDDFEGDE